MTTVCVLGSDAYENLLFAYSDDNSSEVIVTHYGWWPSRAHARTALADDATALDALDDANEGRAADAIERAFLGLASPDEVFSSEEVAQLAHGAGPVYRAFAAAALPLRSELVMGMADALVRELGFELGAAWHAEIAVHSSVLDNNQRFALARYLPLDERTWVADNAPRLSDEQRAQLLAL